MKVTVKLLGVLGDLAETAGRGSIDFTLPSGASAADLLLCLTDRFGHPFDEIAPKVFVDGEFLADIAQPLSITGSETARVQVLLTRSVSGG